MTDNKPSTGEPLSLPESKETLAMQLKQLADGKRSAVFVAEGSPKVLVPRGMNTIPTHEGRIHFNPKFVSANHVHQAIANGRLSDLLGYVQNKSEALDSSLRSGGMPKFVVSRDANGIEQDAAAVSPDRVHEQAQIFAHRAKPGSMVGVEDSSKTIASRENAFKGGRKKYQDGGGPIKEALDLAQRKTDSQDSEDKSAGPKLYGALEIADKATQEKPYGEFGVLPLRTDNGKVVYDPHAGSLTEFVKHAFTPKISPAEIAHGAYEMIKAIPKSIYSGATLPGDVVTGKVDPMSDEGIKRTTDLAGIAMTGSFGGTKPAGALASGASREAEPLMTKTQSQAAAKANWEKNPDPNFNSWQHKWNVEEGQKYRVAPPQKTEPLPVVQQKPTGFQLPEPYNRVTNPAGFYSHAAEAARALPQQKGTLEQMLAALKGYGVKPEEIRWSGVEQAFADRPNVTSEELAQHFEQKLPKVDRITKSEISEEIDDYVIEDIAGEEFNQIYGEEFADDLARELEDHDLENMSESAREMLEERLGDRITEDYWERAYERAHDTARERAQQNAPKWGGKDYNFPGGEDYFENILTLPYLNMSGIHPDVMDYATKTELKELENAKNTASRNFDNVVKNTRLRIRNFHENNLDELAQRKINELKAFGHKFTTQDEVKAASERETEAFNNYLQADKAFKNAMGTGPIEEFEAGQIMNKAEAAHKKAEEEFKKIRDNNEQNYYYNLLTELRGKYKPETLAEEIGKTEEYKALEHPPEQDVALEEMQQANREHNNLYHQLLEASKPHWSKNPEYEGEFFQHKTHLGDITNPILHGRFQTHNVRNPETGEMMKVLNESESQSDWSKENFVRHLNQQEQQELSDLSQKFEVERTPEENLRLSELLTSVKSPGKTKEVPYVGKLKHWSDLAAKDALSHAIENGFDRIFITGGQEQAARWSSGIRSAAENIDWQTRSELGSVDLPPQVLEPYAHALFSKQYYDLTQAERDSLRRKVDLIQRGKEENIFPKNIYAIPEDGKVVNVQMANGQDVRMTVKSIVQPNGQKKNIVVQADRDGVAGQPLSAVVGSDLEKQIMAAKDGRKDLSNYMMGASGYEHIYDKEKPDSYRRVIKSLDPKAKVEPGVMPIPSDKGASLEKVQEAFSRMSPDQKEAFGSQVEELLRLMGDSSNPYYTYSQYMRSVGPYEVSYKFKNYMKQFETDDRKGTWVHITPKMREEYQRLKRQYGAVFPAYKKGGVVKDALNIAQRCYAGGGTVKDALDLAFRNKKLPQMSDTVLDVPRKAAEMYPFIAKNKPNTKINIRPDRNWAETYSPGEPGDPKKPVSERRPKEFPLQETGVEIYRPDFSPADYAAEYLHVDPKANRARDLLTKTIRPDQMRHIKEEDDYQESLRQGQSLDRALQNQIDGMLRGYVMQNHGYLPNQPVLPARAVFDKQHQQPEFVVEEMKYSPEQKNILEDLKRYTTQRAVGGPVMHDDIMNALRLANERRGYADGGAPAMMGASQPMGMDPTTQFIRNLINAGFSSDQIDAMLASQTGQNSGQLPPQTPPPPSPPPFKKHPDLVVPPERRNDFVSGILGGYDQPYDQATVDNIVGRMNSGDFTAEQFQDWARNQYGEGVRPPRPRSEPMNPMGGTYGAGITPFQGQPITEYANPFGQGGQMTPEEWSRTYGPNVDPDPRMIKQEPSQGNLSGALSGALSQLGQMVPMQQTPQPFQSQSTSGLKSDADFQRDLQNQLSALGGANQSALAMTNPFLGNNPMQQGTGYVYNGDGGLDQRYGGPGTSHSVPDPGSIALPASAPPPTPTNPGGMSMGSGLKNGPSQSFGGGGGGFSSGLKNGPGRNYGQTPTSGGGFGG